MRELNAAARRSLGGRIDQWHYTIAHELSSLSANLARTQVLAQDASHQMDLVHRDLRSLGNLLDTVTCLEFVPGFVMPPRGAAPNPSTAAASADSTSQRATTTTTAAAAATATATVPAPRGAQAPSVLRS